MTTPARWRLPFVALVLIAIGLGLVALFVFIPALIAYVQTSDYEVYRGAVAFWRSGHDLYDFVLHAGPGMDLPFTYPPFAAIAFWPTTLVGVRVGFLIWTAAQFSLVLLLAVVMVRRSPARARWGTVEGWLVVLLSFLALALNEPVAHGISIGQVSLALVAMVVVDITLVPPGRRGVLIGLAGAIKLLALVLVPYFVITRQWRAAVTTSLTAAAATAVGFIVLPADSVNYWTQLLFETDRVGEASAVRNKSLLGLMTHAQIGGDLQRPLWLALVVAITAVALWRAWRHHRDGDEVAAMLVMGMLSNVVSPISWPHHLVWLSLTGLYLALRPGWARWAGIAVLVGYLTILPTISYVPTAPAWQLVLGDSAGVVLLLFAVLGLPRRKAAEPSSATPAPADLHEARVAG